MKPTTTNALFIRGGLWIPLPELRFTFSRARGPGGQNVNKVNTRVTLQFHVDESPSLSPSQKHRLHQTLKGRITGDGQLHLASDRSRTQSANRAEVTARFQRLLAQALTPVVPRVATRPTHGSKAARLRTKQRRSQTKQLRHRAAHNDHDR